MQLTPEESLVLLTCRPYLRESEDVAIQRLAAGPVNWDYLLWRAEFYRTIPLLWSHLRRLDADGNVPEHVRSYLQNWSSLSCLRARVLANELGAILDAFEAAGIRYFLLKGAAIAPLVYPDPWLRPALDVDLMIQPHQVSLARQVVVDLGYLHGLWDPDTDRFTPLSVDQIAEYQSEHYELPGFTKRVYKPVTVPAELIPASWRRKHLKCFVGRDQIASFPVFVDLHFNLSLGFDLADVWRGSHPEPILGRSVPVQSITGMVWFLASRLYNEAFQINTFKLIMFGDLHAILYKRGESVDWEELAAVTEKYGMQPSLFYVLAQLRKITGVHVPEEILERLRPDRREVPHSNDWGDLMPRLFSRVILHDIELA